MARNPIAYTYEADTHWDAPEPIPARCGRTDPHGAHRTVASPIGWCAGNVNVITEQRAADAYHIDVASGEAGIR
jgi:hypothetical protein